MSKKKHVRHNYSKFTLALLIAFFVCTILGLGFAIPYNIKSLKNDVLNYEVSQGRTPSIIAQDRFSAFIKSGDRTIHTILALDCDAPSKLDDIYDYDDSTYAYWVNPYGWEMIIIPPEVIKKYEGKLSYFDGEELLYKEPENIQNVRLEANFLKNTSSIMSCQHTLVILAIPITALLIYSTLWLISKIRSKKCQLKR